MVCALELAMLPVFDFCATCALDLYSETRSAEWDPVICLQREWDTARDFIL